jgi:hypothetical protein
MDPYPDGQALIRAMHDRYAGKWYETLTFVQTTSLSKPEPHQETWYEALRVPGYLRIDIAPLDSGTTLIFRGDSIYIINQGTLRGGRPLVHPLMVLGFDVYHDPADRTVQRLTGLGFDLGRIREDTWQGRKVYVVGADAGDSTTAQFWVDRERLLLVRMLEPAKDKSGATNETQFNNYQQVGGGWVAAEVVFNRDGATVTREEYADIRGEVPLPQALFDPEHYARPEWVTR